MAKFSPEVQAMIDRVKNYEDEPPKPKPVPKKRSVSGSTGPSRRGEGFKNKGPNWHNPQKYDYNEIVDLWNTGLTQKEVAKQIGCSEQTVRNALKAINPEGYNAQGYKRLAEECSKGHKDFQRNNQGQRFCRTCRNIYQNNRDKAKRRGTWTPTRGKTSGSDPQKNTSETA